MYFEVKLWIIFPPTQKREEQQQTKQQPHQQMANVLYFLILRQLV